MRKTTRVESQVILKFIISPDQKSCSGKLKSGQNKIQEQNNPIHGRNYKYC